jgi:hypothetical protein
LVWYPIGVKNEADAEIATAIANALGSRPDTSAVDTAIG